MNRAKLKSYAPKARKDFLRAVSDRARKVGLTPVHTEPVEVRGDVAVIGGHAFPKRVADQRRRLDEQIRRKGFTAVMEEAAYTWFNRFMAIRYMEMHGYLEHGYRVLSDPSGKDRPQILEQAEHVTLPGVDKGAVIDLKLDGTKDEELYKLLLLGQCHALHLAMPFLFERIDDQTELLLPDNLLASDSVIRKMVTEIAEVDWERVEIIGWLYQFYISEKKDALMSAKKAYASEDIPAVTQLFTPNWIVKYMVQNSLGRQWLATYPQSPLRGLMEYYIEPAEQTEDVKAQIAAITPKELNPEALTLIDPAVGSGHILVEAYDLFKEIYLERGYRLRDIPRLILEKNLFGLEIDDRAAQMAGFALMMKARADDRRILEQTPTLNVRAIQSSAGLKVGALISALLAPKTIELVPNRKLFPEINAQPALASEEVSPVLPGEIAALLELFVEGKTFGSLVTVPVQIVSRLPYLRSLIAATRAAGDLLALQAADELEPLVAQAELLSRQYDVSTMNPPYLGSKGMNVQLKEFAGKQYLNSKSDLFAMFIERGLIFVKPSGSVAMITMQSWMFLSSYEELRETILQSSCITSFIHNGRGIFGSDFGSCTFVIEKSEIPSYVGTFFRLFEKQGSVASIEELARRFFTFPRFFIAAVDLKQIPGKPIAYWVSDYFRSVFARSIDLSNIFPTRLGLSTANNDMFLRCWHEVDWFNIGVGLCSREDAVSSQKRWFPYQKGGEFRKWYGNNLYVVDWANDGERIRNYGAESGKIRSHNYNLDYIFHEGVTWSDVTSGANAFRYMPQGFLFDGRGSSGFVEEAKRLPSILSLLNSKVSYETIRVLNPTIAVNVGEIGKIPVVEALRVQPEEFTPVPKRCISLAHDDWNCFEVSWEFSAFPFLGTKHSLKQSYFDWETSCEARHNEMLRLEEENNRLFIEAYDLQSELTPAVPEDQITLARANQEQDTQRLISYSLGCMLGRYSLDEPGLIYAYSGNNGFDPSRYPTFPADSDGILPLTDTDWFGGEDTANRFGDFLKAAWPAETFHENVQFVADSLSPKASEAPMDTIRRYLATGFYKDHLQTYKKRPIYWLFSSGKERAFQALVYLHRYNEGTLARMRMEYVVPLQSRLSARMEQLDKDIAASTSTADRKKRQGERDKLSRQYLELLAFDEKLRHYADQRIRLDLDDGVKVNYGKFGDLLAEVKAITGDKDE